MTDSNAQLAALRALRAATTDPVQCAALDAAIAAFEAQQPRSHAQDISGEAQVGVAVAGDIHGDVQSGGQRYEALLQVFFQAAGAAQPTDEQREVLTSYLDGLARRCDRLRLTGVVDWERKRGKAPAFTLSQVYVTLAADAWITVGEAETEDVFADALRAGDPDAVLPQHARRVTPALHMDGAMLPLRAGRADATPRYRLERPLLVTKVLSQRRQIVLLGGPGSGKSTMLRHLAVALARAADDADAAAMLPGWAAGLLLPLYASLGGFAAWAQTQRAALDASSLWRYLLEHSESAALDGLHVQIKRAFRNQRLLLLLDGLDEVADPALRAQVAAAVAVLAEPGGYVVVTCRVRSFVDDVAAPLAAWGDPVELAPFMLGQIRHFVRGWYARGVEQGALEPNDADRRVAQLSERIAALPTLRDLAQTPLLLTIITILHYYEGKLPEDRADLYEDMVQLLLTRWTQQRREAGAPDSLIARLQVGGLREFHLRNVLEELAERAHQSAQSPDGRGLLHRGVVREALIALFRQFDLADGPANEKAVFILRYLEDESGLLLHEGGDMYGLPHLTYEEYLAGCALVKQEQQFHTLAYTRWQADATRWREVILLALGRMVRADKRESAAQWLQFLLLPAHGERARDDAERQRAALFAAECLLDIGGKPALIGATTVDLARLWNDLASMLAQIIEGTLLPAADRVRAGELLCLLDLHDPRDGVCTLPPAMITIPSGTFVIGSTPEQAEQAGIAWEQVYRERGDNETAQSARRWPKDEINDQPLTPPAFEIARYPVTNAQYEVFIDHDGYNPDAPWWDAAGRVWLGRDDQRTEGLQDWQRRRFKQQPEFWNRARFGRARPNHPVVGVSWYEAVAFCRWLTEHLHDGYVYRLPTEAEWEYAARDTERRIYPWGDAEPDDERANFDQTYNGTTAVGCFPRGATPEGVLDLAGNVWEWTGSVYAPYPYEPADGREDAGNPAEKRFTLRGGDWDDQSIYLRASYRLYVTPADHFVNVGLRLARHLPV